MPISRRRTTGPRPGLFVALAVFWFLLAAAAWLVTDQVVMAALAAVAGVCLLGAARTTRRRERSQGRMPADLNPFDVDELRRRVVDPVVKSLVHPEELEEILVTVDALPGGIGTVIVKVRARGEWIIASPAEWGFTDNYRLWNAEESAMYLYVDLRDELVESRLSWGEWRDGEYEVLGPPGS